MPFKVVKVKEKQPPVSGGERIKVLVEAGRGASPICKLKGYIIFVKNGVVGSTQTIEVKKVFPRFAFAEVV